AAFPRLVRNPRDQANSDQHVQRVEPGHRPVEGKEQRHQVTVRLRPSPVQSGELTLGPVPVTPDAFIPAKAHPKQMSHDGQRNTHIPITEASSCCSRLEKWCSSSGL